MLSSSKLKFSLQQVFYLIFAVIGTVAVLYYGSTLIVPLIVALFCAVVFIKPIDKLIQKGLPEWLSISISILIFLVVSTGVFVVIFWQFNVISQDLPEIKTKGEDMYNMIANWSVRQFGYNIFESLSESGELFKTLKSYVAVWASSFASFVTQMVMVLVYLVFILMQRKTFKKFIYKSFSEDKKETIASIIKQSKKSITNYILGKGIIILILFVVYYIGFLLVGVPHALFLALFASIFSIIPYIGNVIGGGVAAGLATLYSGVGAGILVVAVISVAQVAESYVLTPFIIGDQIDLNPFITIFGVVAFSLLWGMIGTIIALPILGVIKVVVSHIEGMENFKVLLEKEKD
ncbi:MAG: AI-2E family transporter [Bacteroidetes bacterium]|nr:AI-2E family transporter [Bacteroidota bacterium]